jgi:hypothetical protein
VFVIDLLASHNLERKKTIFLHSHELRCAPIFSPVRGRESDFVKWVVLSRCSSKNIADYRYSGGTVIEDAGRLAVAEI